MSIEMDKLSALGAFRVPAPVAEIERLATATGTAVEWEYVYDQDDVPYAVVREVRVGP